MRRLHRLRNESCWSASSIEEWLAGSGYFTGTRDVLSERKVSGTRNQLIPFEYDNYFDSTTQRAGSIQIYLSSRQVLERICATWAVVALPGETERLKIAVETGGGSA
jgi:hypothetical protein